MIYKQIGKIKFTTSWDDGSPEDMRLVELLDRFSFPATFYISPKYKKYGNLTDDEIKHIGRNKLFEIGGHTLTHPELPFIPKQAQIDEIKAGKDYLRSILPTHAIRSFSYPRGRYNKEVIASIKDCGFREGRTVDVLETKMPTDLFRTKTTIHAHPARVEYKGRDWLEVAKELWLKEDTEYYHLWGHSHEITKFELWEDLENLLLFIKSYEH